jgi:hypothetical protein
MSLSHSPKVVTDGLVLYLDAANQRSYPKSGTTWSDLSASGYTGTLYNDPTFNSNNRGAIVFDGSNDYCLVTDWQILTGNAHYTYNVFFVKYSNANSNWVSYGTSSTSRANQCGIFSGTLGALNYGNDTGVSASSVSNDNWHMLTVTHNGSTTTVYIDGIYGTSKSTTYNFASSNLNIGRAYTGGYYANISLGHVQIYNRALTGDEVRQNYLATRGRYK